MPIASGVMLDFLHAPTNGFMETNRAFVAQGRDGFHAFCASFSTIRFERRVKQSGYAATSVVGMNADEVDIADRRIWCDKPEQETHEMPVVFDDPRQLSEFVEINRVGQRAGWTAPPAIDDGDNMVEIGFFEGSRGQVVHMASGFHPSRVVRAYLHRVMLQKPFAHSKKSGWRLWGGRGLTFTKVVGTFGACTARRKNMLAVRS